MKNLPLPRLDTNEEIREQLLPYCRLKFGDVWIDPESGHKVACIDATSKEQVSMMMGKEKAKLAVHDPPYNLIAFATQNNNDFITWCEKWIATSGSALAKDSALYIWLGAEQENGFQPLPEFMIMMRGFEEFKSRSFITMRNQRGYGTQKNWMAVRQECLYYIKGSPEFSVQYTEIPKILKGYYKEVNGQRTENFERSKSDCIRPGNVWVDIQQVFYRMEENVNGCYAQKPLKCIERLVLASSKEKDTVIDFFGHSGSTLIACELNKRKCFTADIDPVFCEIMIRRLEHFRISGRSGWQNGNPFETELNGASEAEQIMIRHC